MFEIQNSNEDIVLSSDENIIHKCFSSKSKNKITAQQNINFRYLILSSDGESDISFDIEAENVKWDIFAIFFGDNANTSNISVNISSSNSHINVLTLSFIQTDSKFDINWVIKLWKNVSNSQWHLLEKNIILGSKAKIKSIPRLDVYSNDVKATHWLSIDRINKEEMFYLNSKWLDQSISKEMIIKWYLQNILSKFEDLSESQNNEIEKMILSQINFNE